jgi:hypothetical protein
LPIKYAASAGAKCVGNRFASRPIHQNYNWEFGVSARHSFCQIETASDVRIEIGADDYKINTARPEHLKEVGGSSRNGITPEIMNKGIHQQITAHGIAADNRGAKCRLGMPVNWNGFLLVNRPRLHPAFLLLQSLSKAATGFGESSCNSTQP